MNGYIYENPKSGYLTFQVSSGAIPIPNAKITVSKNIGDNMYIGKTLLTDINGKTSEIPLPAPDKSLSLSPGSYKPYSTYDISVSADGYLTEYFYDVPVFGGGAVHGAVKTAGGHTGPGNGGTAPPHPAQRHKNI